MKILKWVLSIVLVAGLILGGVWVYVTIFDNEETVIGEEGDGAFDQVQTVSVEEIQRVLEPAAELVTAQYHYKDAGTYENYEKLFGKKFGFMTDKFVFTYSGVVSVGIELDDIVFTVDDENKTIDIKLPPIEIKHNEVDEKSFETPYEKDSIFASTKFSDFSALRAELQEEKAADVLADKEFMSFAEKNTKQVIENLLRAAGITEIYTINFS